MDFKISRGQKQCSVCSRAFADKEKYVTGLLNPRSGEEGTFDRQDFCQSCWERQGPGALTAFWPNQYSTSKKPALLDPDLLWQVFHKARTGKEPDMPKFAYVAALGLMRLKKLKLKATKREGKKEILVFETPGRKPKEREEFEIPNPALDEAAVGQVQDRLGDLA